MCKIHLTVRLAASFNFGVPVMLRKAMTDELLFFRFWCSVMKFCQLKLNGHPFESSELGLSMTRANKFALYSVYSQSCLLTSLSWNFSFLSRLVLISLLRILLPLLSGILLRQYLDFEIKNSSNERVTITTARWNQQRKAWPMIRVSPLTSKGR